MSNGNPIIIGGGGSIEITLHKDTFPQDTADSARHYNSDRKLTRLEVTDDTTGKSVSYEVPDHGRVTIRVHHSL